MIDITERGCLAREDRRFSFDEVELREEDDGSITFDGIASVVEAPYMVRDAFGEFEETFTKGAFNKTLKEKDDIRLLVNHDGIPLARRRGARGDTLKLTVEPHLRAVAPLDPASPLVQTVRSAMDRGDMDQMSIGFRATRQEWNADYTQRTIREAQLFDVSLVTYPANVLTSASLRSLADLCELTEADPDELRRAIAHLESLLPVEERVETMHPDLVEAHYTALRRMAAFKAA